MNWQRLATQSHYQTAVAIQKKLLEQDIAEATLGIEELIEALSRSDKRALRSQLTRLMLHIIKWRLQPDYRSRSWLSSISNARVEIAALLEDEPGLRRVIPELWEKCFRAAQKLAYAETGIQPKIAELTENEVFDKEYTLS